MFIVFVKKINGKNVIGIGEPLEMKQRFHVVKCISTYGEISEVWGVSGWFFEVFEYDWKL